MNNLALNRLNEEMENIIFSMVESPAPDYPSYRERIGKYNGLKEAVQIVTQAEKEDDI